jgi:hypothetical protein
MNYWVKIENAWVKVSQLAYYAYNGRKVMSFK